MKIKRIKAVGPFVRFITSDGKTVTITRAKALERAQAITGLSPDAPDIQREIIKACREAHRNETGHDYHSNALKMITVEETHIEREEKKKNVARLMQLDAFKK